MTQASILTAKSAYVGSISVRVAGGAPRLWFTLVIGCVSLKDMPKLFVTIM